MSEIYLSRRETFSSSHLLYSEQLSEEENIQIFDKCTRLHGHNYTIHVVLKGPINPKTGMLINLTDLKAIIHEEVIRKVDHYHLNDLPEFQTRIPTAENIAIVAWSWLQKRLGELLYEVSLYETENNVVTYRGHSS